jgi:hypothetical protein
MTRACEPAFSFWDYDLPASGGVLIVGLGTRGDTAASATAAEDPTVLYQTACFLCPPGASMGRQVTVAQALAAVPDETRAEVLDVARALLREAQRSRRQQAGAKAATPAYGRDIEAFERQILAAEGLGATRA